VSGLGFVKGAEPFPVSALLNPEGQEEITLEFKPYEIPLSMPALLNLGVLSALGKGVPQDYATAIELLNIGMELPRLIGMIKIRNSMDYEDYLAHWLSTFPKDKFGIRDGQLAITIAEDLVKKS
jgi:hypothetical protein